MGVEAKEASPRTGYSPPLTLELRVSGQTFNVAAMGPGQLIVRNPRPVPPGPATVHLIVDGRETVYRVHLTNGVDPMAGEQHYTHLR